MLDKYGLSYEKRTLIDILGWYTLTSLLTLLRLTSGTNY